MTTEAQTTTLPLRGFYLSQQFKGAFKTALAMVITFGIALSMGWSHPYWAGLAVALCSLSTTGESLHKGLLRIGGTFVAFFVALALIALFPQDRWLFLVALSVYLGFCNYMMGGTSRWYFWSIAASTVPILTFGTGPESLNAFDTVVLRAQMTGTGVLVYSLVSTLLWPTSTKDVFEEAVRKLASGQHQLFRKYAVQLAAKGDDDDISTLRAQVIQGAGALKGLLNGAEVDSLEVWEVRQAWRQCLGQIAELNTMLDRWRHCFDELQKLDIERLVPQLSTLTAEIEERFRQIERMLDGKTPEARPQEISLQLEKVNREGLSHFQRASIVVGMRQLTIIDELTQLLFGTISSIRGFRVEDPFISSQSTRKTRIAFDPDRAAAVLRMLICAWSAFLMWLFLPDVPAYSAFLSMTISIALMFIIMPQIPIKILPKPMLLSVFYAAVVHIFIMPHLDGFAELSLVIFGGTFALCYLYAKPQQMISRSAGLAFFMVLTGIGTPQVYSFLKIANIGLVLMMIVCIFYVATYFPISFRPEVRFLQMLKRFFKSCEYLIAEGSTPVKPWSLQGLRLAFHSHEVSTVPAKLQQWGGVLSPDALGKTSPENIHGIINGMQILSWYVLGLVAIREETGLHDQASRDLLDEIQAWRRAFEGVFTRLSVKPDAEDAAILSLALDDLLDRLETKIKQSPDIPENDERSEYKGYQLLGAYRGLSEALVAYARTARTIDWPRLAENRF